MPELTDEMYCSQQIMVPPMFPYLLRQYAKAAIRSQPSDLLRWSTAYFRCLSLNLPPPVKPRLEYPIPKDYDGITPGWLKALLHQFKNSSHVDFKVLWDRWIGACLNHHTLIKILCLSGFTDAFAIPFLRFIGLCIGFLSENLTQTMIMVCEVLTEEPEGGSAMLSVEIFIDIYTFLANIDASKDQIILNRYFTDYVLELLERKEKAKKAEKKHSLAKEAEVIIIEEEFAEEEEKEISLNKDEISCPDLADDVDGGSEQNISQTSIFRNAEQRMSSPGKESDMPTSQKVPEESTLASETLESSMDANDDEVKDETDDAPEKEAATIDEDADQDDVDAADGGGDDNAAATDDNVSLADETKDDEAKLDEAIMESEEHLSMGEENLEDLTEAMGEDYTSEDFALTDEQSILDKPIGVEDVESFNTISTADVAEEEESEEEKLEYEEVFVEAIPGIGSIVPAELVDAVVEYMKKCAEQQHGMVMPRNIRHYSCPPLEVFD